MTTPKREYIIGLLNYEDLDNFYNDMESAGTGMHDCFPDREVECATRRPISRNTHYWLTDEEAEQIRKDPRVQVVSLTLKDLGVTRHPLYEQTSSNWNKTQRSGDNSMRNWGLLRSTINQQIPKWGGISGYENISSGYNDIPTQTATVNIPSSGKHVDVIVCDGHVLPDHPEFAVNSDGTGGSRVKQINWFALGVNPSVDPPTYVYSTGLYGNDHGTHVAGTIAGNSQGWARDANIYNIYPYGNVNLTDDALFDYMRAFHKQKPINPITGRKNPTIVNNSWGSGNSVPPYFITDIQYRGVNTTFNYFEVGLTQLKARGVTRRLDSSGNYSHPTTIGSEVSILDMEDAMAEGIIFTAAAGNDARKNSRYGDQDYDNVLKTYGVNAYFYNRGAFPGISPGIISVGALGPLSQEYKAPFSACGPRTDVYAPGINIISSVASSPGPFSGSYDFRNDQYYIDQYGGTSMATPQVTGVLACALELYPNMTQYDALLYIKTYSLQNQMTDGGNSDDTMGSYDVHQLAGSTNRILKYNRERNSTGAVYPKLNVAPRQTTGLIPYTYENGWRQEFNKPPHILDLAIWIGTKLYESNDQFTTASGIRYGLYKQPDALSLNYWVNDAVSRYGDQIYFNAASRQSIIDNFFVSIASTADASRALTNNKTFLYGSSQTRGTTFSDRLDKKAGQVYPRPRIYTFGVQKSN